MLWYLPKTVKYPRNTDLIVAAPPIYLQEKVEPKALIEDLLARSASSGESSPPMLAHRVNRTPSLFSDFNGIPEWADKTDFYQHDQRWSNHMILGDSLQVTGKAPYTQPMHRNVRQGFVYERVPHITLKSIAEIDVIWTQYQAKLEPLRMLLTRCASIGGDETSKHGKPKSGRIAVKVINHLGDEVIEVFRC